MMIDSYYNENDPRAAGWLRELINNNQIASGDVDERSITDVRADELSGYTQHHFFAGIGGWSYALRLAGWPDDRPVCTGSCPCQPFSIAGKGLGESDQRHLWPAFRDIISQLKPSTCFGEQVASSAGREWLVGVRSDLEAMGYAVGAADLCAAGVGAPQIRQRLFWVAGSGVGAGDGRLLYGRGEGVGSDREEASGELEGRGGADWLADSDRSGRIGQGSAEPAEKRLQARSEQARKLSDEPEGSGRTGRLADANGVTRRLPDEQWAKEPEATGAGIAHGLADGELPAVARLGEYSREVLRDEKPEGFDICSPWDDFRVVYCRDGKYRRIPIEPELFPLSDGVPGSVGMLRGYGNAIVPQVAAEFIGACIECGAGCLTKIQRRKEGE